LGLAGVGRTGLAAAFSPAVSVGRGFLGPILPSPLKLLKSGMVRSIVVREALYFAFGRSFADPEPGAGAGFLTSAFTLDGDMSPKPLKLRGVSSVESSSSSSGGGMCLSAAIVMLRWGLQ
jgi:hypothetical protein